MVISEIQRNPQQRNSAEMEALVASRETARSLFDQLKPALSAAVGDVCRVAEIITPSANSLQNTLNNPTLTRDKALRDNFILECILQHSNTESDAQKALLSSNTKDFGTQEARFALRNYGVIYFSDINKLLNWMDSQS